MGFFDDIKTIKERRQPLLDELQRLRIEAAEDARNLERKKEQFKAKASPVIQAMLKEFSKKAPKAVPDKFRVYRDRIYSALELFIPRELWEDRTYLYLDYGGKYHIAFDEDGEYGGTVWRYRGKVSPSAIANIITEKYIRNNKDLDDVNIMVQHIQQALARHFC